MSVICTRYELILLFKLHLRSFFSCGCWVVGIDEPGWCAVATFRDLDYGFDTSMENLVDPSHIPVAHHNVNGGIMGKRDNAAPIALELKSMNARGFVGEWKKPWGGTSEHTYEAPSRFTYMFPLKGIKGASGCTTTYVTPMCRWTLLAVAPSILFCIFLSVTEVAVSDWLPFLP